MLQLCLYNMILLKFEDFKRVDDGKSLERVLNDIGVEGRR